MPSSASPSGICPPLPLDYLSPLIVGITDDEQICLLFQGPRLLGQILPIPLGMPWHMSAPRVVSHYPCDPVGASFPRLPEGMG